MDDPHRIDALRAMLASPGWEEVLAPEAQRRLEGLTYKALAGRGSLSEGELRSILGESASLQWVLAWPWKEIEEFELALQLKAEEDQRGATLERAEEHELRYGHRSPFLPETSAEGEE